MRRIDRRKELREMDHQDHGFYSGNGISRYHSAPGSLLSNLTTKEGSSNSGQSNGTLPAIYCTGMPPVAAAAWRGGLDLTSSMSGHSQGHSHGESGVFTGSRNKQENSEQESGGDSQGRGRCFTFMETLRGNTSPRKGEFVGQQPAAPRGGSPAGLLQKLQIQGQAQEQRSAGGILSRSRSDNVRNLHRDLGSSSIDPALWESQDASSYLPDDRSKRLLDLGIDQFGDISFQEDSGLEHPAIALTRHLGFATAGRSPESISALHDSVPCRFRAKRGCATHPRSIAERNRRTRISERMRKLQELVPNMDKQTNTADMLDETIDYVKLLQRQVQELSDCELKCRGLCKKQRPGEDEKQNSK